MDLQQQIDRFLDGSPHAVVGASADRDKYGNKVLRAYLQTDRPAFPVNPNATMIEGLEAFDDLKELPQPIHGISIITPPPVTEGVVRQAVELGIQHIWIQPGAESEAAIAHASGVNLIAGGPCLLVALRYRDAES